MPRDWEYSHNLLPEIQIKDLGGGAVVSLQWSDLLTFEDPPQGLLQLI
jgi:hypothetical protein